MDDTELHSLRSESVTKTPLLEILDGECTVPRSSVFCRMENLYLLFWYLAALIGVTTTKSLVSQHFHYPYHLLFFHVTAALILRAIRNGLSRAYYGDNAELQIKPGGSLRAWWLYVVGVSGALGFVYQAVLHTPNFLSLLLVASLDWKPPQATGIQDFGSTFRQLTFLSGVSMLFLFDFRLIPLGMIMSVLAAGFAGLAVSSQYFISADIMVTPAAGLSMPRPTLKLSPSVAALLTTWLMTVLLISWYENPAIIEYSRCITSAIELCIGVVASAVALEGGCFVARPLEPFCTVEIDNISSFERVALASAFTGTAGLLSYNYHEILLPISIWQLAGYFVASLAMLDVSTLVDRPAASKLPRYLRSAQMGTTYSKILSNTDWVQRRMNVRLVLLLMISIMSWFGVLHYSLTFAGPPPTILVPKIDRSYQPDADFDIVVSYYEEPSDAVAHQLGLLVNLPRLSGLKPRVFVYAKSDERNASYMDELKKKLPDVTISIERLENVGREADSYLHHIIEQWDDLARHTLFMQASMHHSRLSLRRIEDYFRRDTGFLSIQMESAYCKDCSDCYDRYWSDSPDVLQDMYYTANNDTECKDIVLTYKGQFVASGTRIRGNNVKVYQDLRDDLRNPSSAVHQLKYTESVWHTGQTDSMNSPTFGYTLERMWGVLLQCSERRIAYKCPSLLSGMVSVVDDADISDCQCLDS